MGLYKLSDHTGRSRDRCERHRWGSVRGVRVSLSKWTDREIRSRAEAGAALHRERHVVAKDLASTREHEAKVAPFLARFVRTVDIEDVVSSADTQVVPTDE